MCGRTPARSEVYGAIDDERLYQESLPPSRTDGSQKSVGDFLLMIEHYLSVARAEWTVNAGDKPALDQVRKIAAIAVQCMEKHGIVRRVERRHGVKV